MNTNEQELVVLQKKINLKNKTLFSIVGQLIPEREKINFNLCETCLVENKSLTCSYQSCHQQLSIYHCSEVNIITSFRERAILCEIIARDFTKIRSETKWGFFCTIIFQQDAVSPKCEKT